MSIFSGKNVFILAPIAVLLLVLPLVVFLLMQQQEPRSRAAPSTRLSFTPDSATTQVGQTVTLDIMMDPGSDQVSFLRLAISYDPTKLTASQSAFIHNASGFPEILQGPTYSNGSITADLSIGGDPTKAITTPIKVASVSFQAKEATAATPTQLTFSSQTKALSIEFSDASNENVISVLSPARITIGAAQGGGPPPTPTIPQPTITVAPPPAGGNSTGSAVQNQAPVCSAFSLDAAGEGNAPLSLLFTISGNDPDGTISKATVNFGDGAVQDLTDGGGIGTNAVQTQISHTYNTVGTYIASAVLTDNLGILSSSQSCTQTIKVTSPQAQKTPIPTLEAPGAEIAAVGIGLGAVLVSIIGVMLLFIL